MSQYTYIDIHVYTYIHIYVIHVYIYMSYIYVYTYICHIYDIEFIVRIGLVLCFVIFFLGHLDETPNLNEVSSWGIEKIKQYVVSVSIR